MMANKPGRKMEPFAFGAKPGNQPLRDFLEKEV